MIKKDVMQDTTIKHQSQYFLANVLQKFDINDQVQTTVLQKVISRRGNLFYIGRVNEAHYLMTENWFYKLKLKLNMSIFI